MRVLFFGDIVGKIGRQAAAKILPELKKKYRPNFIIANAENLAHGLGVTKKTLKEAIDAGINCFTSGNHIWAKSEVYKIFEDAKTPLIRPANYPPKVPGQGYKVFKVGKNQLAVINLMGRIFLHEDPDCPFRKIDEILLKLKRQKKVKTILIDFHSEATSEKKAFGFYVDGRVSAVVGTHTHVGTSDPEILNGGTAYISDAGMVGAKDSIIGGEKEPIIRGFLTQIPAKFEIPKKGKCVVNAVLIDINPKTGLARSIKRVDQEVGS